MTSAEDRAVARSQARAALLAWMDMVVRRFTPLRERLEMALVDDDPDGFLAAIDESGSALTPLQVRRFESLVHRWRATMEPSP